MAASVKDVAKALLAEGKYPKKDGGVITISGDQGEVVVLRENGKAMYQFITLNKQVVLQIPMPAGKQGPPASVVAAAKAKEKKAPPPAVKPDPQMVEQLGYDSKPELVDYNTHPNIITCDCGNVRYVAPGDMWQVTKCKPCTRRARRQRRRLSLKNRGKLNTSEAKGLTFPAKKAAEAQKKKEAAKIPAKKAAPAPVSKAPEPRKAVKAPIPMRKK